MKRVMSISWGVKSPKAFYMHIEPVELQFLWNAHFWVLITKRKSMSLIQLVRGFKWRRGV